MAGYENVTIIGNVGRDPEMRYTQGGMPVCSFSVAVTRTWQDRTSNERKEKTTWFRVTAWRQLAETCNQFVHKGMQVLVVGTVEASAFLNKDGQPAASLELTADTVRFLGQRGEGQGYGDGEYARQGPEDVTDIPF